MFLRRSPDGEVITFKEGTVTIGTATLSGGQATISTSSLSVGPHTIKAVYPGDSGFITSTGVINQKILALTVTSALPSANRSLAGMAVKFAVKVTSPNGTAGSSVTRSVDSVVLGTEYVNAGSAKLHYFSAYARSSRRNGAVQRRHKICA
jgi:Bacterial Ig-like domain (group 3)